MDERRQTGAGAALAVGLGVLVGVALLGVDVRWVSAELGFVDPGRAFVGRWFGLEWMRLDVAAARELGARVTPPAPLGLAWMALAFGLGALVGPRAQRKLGASPAGLGARIACGLAVLFALSPWMLAFVVERTPSSAPLYLDLGDLARAAGLGLLWVSLITGWKRGRDARSVPGTEAPEPARCGSALVAVVFAVLAPFAVSHLALDGEPLTNDGVSYAFQAEVFAQGDVARPVAPLDAFFPARQVLPGARAASKYPPGHALALAPGTLFGAPRLVPFALLGLATFLVFALARLLGARSPDLAAWTFALSPMVVGVESLWLSHGTSLPLGLVFLYAWLRACGVGVEREASTRPAAAWALLAGLALALAFAARPITALALAVPVAACTARHWTPRAIGLGVLGFLPGAAAFLLINNALTGSPWQTAYGLYAELVSSNDRYGLVNLPTAFAYTAYNLARLSAWGTGFGALGLALVLGWRVARPARMAALTWAVPLSFFCFYALHRFQGIPWVGPLYLVEALPVLALLVGGALGQVSARMGVPRVLVVLALALGSLNLLAPHVLLARELQGVRHEPRALAEALADPTAIVFVPLTDPDEHKLFPLPPPRLTPGPNGRLVPDHWPVLARDLGDADNALLFENLAAETAWRYDRAGGRLVPLFDR